MHRRTMVDGIKRIADKELLDEARRNVNIRTALILKHHGIEVTKASPASALEGI